MTGLEVFLFVHKMRVVVSIVNKYSNRISLIAAHIPTREQISQSLFLYATAQHQGMDNPFHNPSLTYSYTISQAYSTDVTLEAWHPFRS